MPKLNRDELQSMSQGADILSLGRDSICDEVIIGNEVNYDNY